MITPISLLFFFTSLLPANIPANMIYMGPSIDPIPAIKIKRGYVSDSTYMLMTPYHFIRVKSAIENSPDLCTLAIDESIKKCMEGMEREQEIMQIREHDDKALIKAYETRLVKVERELETTLEKNAVLLWTTVGLSLITTASITITALR